MDKKTCAGKYLVVRNYKLYYDTTIYVDGTVAALMSCCCMIDYNHRLSQNSQIRQLEEYVSTNYQIPIPHCT